MPVKRFTFIALLATLTTTTFAGKPATPAQSAAKDYTQKEFYQQALAFNRADLVTTYQSKGKHDPKWDAAAIAALEEFALFSTQDQTEAIAFPALCSDPKVTFNDLGNIAQKALDQDCSDPMVLYARATALMNQGHDSRAAPFFVKAVANIEGSPYSAFRKLSLLNDARPFTLAEAQSLDWPAIQPLCIQMAKGPFLNAAAHRMIAKSFLQALSARPHDQYEADLARFSDAAGVDPWIVQNAAIELQLELGWDARGIGGGLEVTNYETFKNHLDKASAAGEAALKIHPEFPEAPTAMIRVAMGYGHLDDVNLWFDRAIAAQPDDSPAYRFAFKALQPRWLGSNDVVLALGKKAAASTRFDTTIPWQFLAAASAVYSDDQGGDRAVFTKSEVQKTGADILNKYQQQWKDNPRLSDFFKMSLAALKIAATKDSKAARKLFDGIPGELDPATFNYFGVDLDSSLEKTLLDTLKDQAGVTKYRAALAKHTYSNTLTVLDDLIKENPDGRDSELLHSLKVGNKLMQTYRANKTISLIDSASAPFWYAALPGLNVDGALVSPIGDHRIQLLSRFFLLDRHYNLHLNFDFSNLPTSINQSVELSFGIGTGGNNWSITLFADPPQAVLLGPGADKNTRLKFKDVKSNAIDIVYWDGIPKVTINGQPGDYSPANPRTVQGLSRDNAIQLNTSGPVRITQFSLQHLDTKP